MAGRPCNIVCPSTACQNTDLIAAALQPRRTRPFVEPGSRNPEVSSTKGPVLRGLVYQIRDQGAASRKTAMAIARVTIALAHFVPLSSFCCSTHCIGIRGMKGRKEKAVCKRSIPSIVLVAVVVHRPRLRVQRR
jgi:hypothetical protein